MWSTSKKDCYLRSILLAINCASCVAIVYLYVTYVGEQGKFNGVLSENIIQPEKLTGEKCIPICDSRACMWHANMLLKNVDTTVDPCDDFHAFLCNGFREEFGYDDKANTISETRKPLINKLKGILDNIQAEPGSASAKMKTVYDSCVDYGSSELQGIRDLQNIFNNVGIPNWPNLPEDFSYNDISMPIVVGSFVSLGARDYISLRDVFNNDTQDHRLMVTFYSYIFDVYTDVPRELAVSLLNYFDLEMKDIESIIEDHRFVKNSIMNLSEVYEKCFNETCPEVHIDCSKQNDDEWQDFCETLKIAVSFLGGNVSAVAIEKPEDMFFKNVFQLLNSFSKRSLSNFFALSFIKGYQEDLNFYFRLAKLKHNDFEHETLIDYYELDRWKFCVVWISNYMKLPLENEFFHQYLTSTATEEITNIYNDYFSDISDLIALQEWIPTDLKSEVVEMLRNLSLNIDHISQVLPNDTFVNKVYEEFHPTKESFFRNVLQIKKITKAIVSSHNLNNKEFVADMADFDVQASAGGPFLDIHFGMLIPPFYIPGHINLLNRAMLAPIIGHEFGHYVFEIFVDKIGDDETFLQKRRCVGDQFSKFKFRYLNENLNGSRYDTENLPDNVGTALIDKVFEKYSASQDAALPGLPYSTKQLFYMTASQMWCSKSNLKKDLHYKNKDPHAPTEYRLVGVMQNTRGHSDAFQCSDGTFMNPATKCSILDTSRNLV